MFNCASWLVCEFSLLSKVMLTTSGVAGSMGCATRARPWFGRPFAPCPSSPSHCWTREVMSTTMNLPFWSAPTYAEVVMSAPSGGALPEVMEDSPHAPETAYTSSLPAVLTLST